MTQAGGFLYLFDIDGTLLRGTPVHGLSFQEAWSRVYGRPDASWGDINAYGRTDSFLLAEPLRHAGLSEAEIDRGRDRAFAIMQDYVEANLGDIRDLVLPGVPEILSALRTEGQLLGLLTGNLSGIAMAKMRRAGLAEFFTAGGFGEESEVRGDLVPAALRSIERESGSTPQAGRTVLVGDTPLDVEAAHVNGALAAAVATGRFSVVELEATGADLVLPSLADREVALRALLGLNGLDGRAISRRP